MKHAALFSLVLFLSLSGRRIYAQQGVEGSLIGAWQTVENINAGSLRNICHQYTLNFTGANAGSLGFQISFLSEDNRNAATYYGVVRFSYEILEEDTSVGGLTMAVAYQEPKFQFQEAPKNSQRPLPPDQLSYLEEFKQYLFNREEEYEMVFEGSTTLTIEGFSLVKNGIYAYFEKGGLGSSPCKNLIRN